MRVTDPKALRAMAHPLRLELIEVLNRTGPATAARCARILGSTQASCSFHLRQLAKYGYVEEADAGPDRRERRWRLVDFSQEISERDVGPAASDEFGRVFVEREATRILDWIDSCRTEPDEWRLAAMLGGATLPLSLEDLDAIKDGFRRVLEPYIARVSPDGTPLEPGQRHVRVFMAANPLPDLDEGDGADVGSA
ncbi:MAG TPA: helix-turn-helix domain-containing protein [Actinocrinis sp.]|nr:helix-turn-helix domain-containing protein [Actinocrinis sp.]